MLLDDPRLSRSTILHCDFVDENNLSEETGMAGQQVDIHVDLSQISVDAQGRVVIDNPKLAEQIKKEKAATGPGKPKFNFNCTC